MKYLCLLATTLCLSAATIIPEPSIKQHNEKLHRRSEGPPPENYNMGSGRPYLYDNDPYGQRQRIDAIRARTQRESRQQPPPQQFRPEDPNPPVERRANRGSARHPNNPRSGGNYRPSSHRDNTQRRAQEERAVDETKRKIALVYTKTTTNKDRPGQEDKVQKSIQFPRPDRGVVLIGGGDVSTRIPLTTDPESRTTVTTGLGGGIEVSEGLVQLTATKAVRKDLNPPPEPVRGKDIRLGRTYQTKSKTKVYFEEDRKHRLIMYRKSDDAEMADQTLDVYKVSKRRRNIMIDASVPTKKRRNNVIDNVVASETTSDPTSSDSALSLQAQWQIYYDIYQSLQANATEIVAPILNNLTNSNNATLVYEMAWSIDSQLLGSPNSFTGAYYYGCTYLDDFMDTWLLQNGFLLDSNGTIYEPNNSTISNSTMDEAIYMLTLNSQLRTLYTETWDAAVQALNVSVPYNNNTILENLVYFASVITATNDTSIVPKSFFEIDGAASDADASWWLPGLGGNVTNW